MSMIGSPIALLCVRCMLNDEARYYKERCSDIVERFFRFFLAQRSGFLCYNFSMKEKLDIEKLYFGVKIIDLNTGEIRTINLFGIGRVAESVAVYVKRRNTKAWKEQVENEHFDPLFFCFGDVWSRVEYEMIVTDMFGKTEEKVDVYRMYVEPNRDLLLDMINRVTVSSARRYLKR